MGVCGSLSSRGTSLGELRGATSSVELALRVEEWDVEAGALPLFLSLAFFGDISPFSLYFEHLPTLCQSFYPILST